MGDSDKLHNSGRALSVVEGLPGDRGNASRSVSALGLARSDFAVLEVLLHKDRSQ